MLKNNGSGFHAATSGELPSLWLWIQAEVVIVDYPLPLRPLKYWQCIMQHGTNVGRFPRNSSQMFVLSHFAASCWIETKALLIVLWSWWKLLETPVGIYISSLTTANINLFALGPPLLIASSTLQCAWVPKLGKSTEKKPQIAPQYKRKHLSIRTSPSCKLMWDRRMGRCYICFQLSYSLLHVSVVRL